MQAHSQQTCLADTVPQSHADTISNDQGSQKGTLFKLPSKTLPPCNNTDSCNPDQRQPKKSTLYIHSALQFTLQLWKPDWSSNESTCWTHFFLCNRKPDWSSNESICWIHFVLCNRKPNWSSNETICSVQQKARLVQQWEYLLNSLCSVQQNARLVQQWEYLLNSLCSVQQKAILVQQWDYLFCATESQTGPAMRVFVELTLFCATESQTGPAMRVFVELTLFCATEQLQWSRRSDTEGSACCAHWCSPLCSVSREGGFFNMLSSEPRVPLLGAAVMFSKSVQNI